MRGRRLWACHERDRGALCRHRANEGCVSAFALAGRVGYGSRVRVMCGRAAGSSLPSVLTGLGTDVIVLPGGGYAEHVPHEAEPVGGWLEALGVRATVFRYPLHARHPVPLEALQAEIRRRRDAGAERIGVLGFSAGGHLAG